MATEDDPPVDKPAMDVSPARLAANRNNAQKSTGPRSDAGKARAAQNATTHGLLSRQVLLLPGEDALEWAAFHERFVLDFAPEGELEQILVERISETAWRLRRVGAAEAGFLRAQIFAAQERRLHGDLLTTLNMLSPPPPAVADRSRELLAERDRGDNNVGRAVAESINVLTKLSRYETQLERSLHKSLRQLAQVQYDRQQKGPRQGSSSGPIIDGAVD